MVAVTDGGAFVPGDQLLALFGRAVASAGDRVAAPVNTSLAVADALSANDVDLVYTPVGDVHVADRATAPDVVIGGEPSGAWIFPTETLCPDGPLAAVRLALLAATTPLSTRLADLEQHPIRRSSIETNRKAETMTAVRSLVTDAFTDVSTLDGVRAETDDGWFLLRASGTQPLIRVTAETRDETAADRLLERATSLVEQALLSTDDG
jgi:phosphoglucosamine mutase